MIKFNLKMIVLLTIAGLFMASCQKEEVGMETPELKADEVVLPKVINIVSADQIPAGGLRVLKSTGNITAYNVQKTYNGKLSNVIMNGNHKNDAENIKIEISAKSRNSFKFYLKPFKIGKMPAKLSVKIDNLTLGTDGKFHADEYNDASLLYHTLRLGILGKFNVTLIDGSFIPVTGGYRLKLTLESRGSIFNIDIFTAHVEYGSYD